MTAMELMACRMPEDPLFSVPVNGYMVTFMAFYERGFVASSHWFLHPLLRY
jgi:hypothetical protein